MPTATRVNYARERGEQGGTGNYDPETGSDTEPPETPLVQVTMGRARAKCHSPPKWSVKLGFELAIFPE